MRWSTESKQGSPDPAESALTSIGSRVHAVGDRGNLVLQKAGDARRRHSLHTASARNDALRVEVVGMARDRMVANMQPQARLAGSRPFQRGGKRDAAQPARAVPDLSMGFTQRR